MPRLHAIDAMRGVMMLLGLVIHSSLTYMVTDTSPAWPLDHPGSGYLVFDLITDLVHNFRMPTFFVISGFFGAFLFYRRGPKSMLLNRIRRVVLPFVVFLPILHILIRNGLAFSWQSFVEGTPGWTPPSDTYPWLPHITHHLWFLYYLIWYTLAAWLLTQIIVRIPALTTALHTGFARVFKHQFGRVLLLAAFTLWPLLVLNKVFPDPDSSFRFGLVNWLFYSGYYFAGWQLYHQQDLLLSLKERWKVYASIAGVLWLIKLVLISLEWHITHLMVVIYLNCLIVPIVTLAVMGIFLKWCANPSPRLRYLSDASYWVYLLHLPICYFLPGVWFRLGVPIGIGFVLTMAITAFVTILSYHFLVRSTFVGMFLNGKKYPKNNISG